MKCDDNIMSPSEMSEENTSEPHRERSNLDNESQDESLRMGLLSNDQSSSNNTEDSNESEQPEIESDEGVLNSTEGTCVDF